MNDGLPAARPAAPQPRPEVLSIDAYVAGEAKLQGANRIIKLSANEGAFGPRSPANCTATPMAAPSSCVARSGRISASMPTASSAARDRTS